MRTISTKDGSLLIVDERDLDILSPAQRGAVMFWRVRSMRPVSKAEGQSLFPGYDHVLYTFRPEWHNQPTTPLDVEHEDIRSERPCK